MRFTLSTHPSIHPSNYSHIIAFVIFSIIRIPSSFLIHSITQSCQLVVYTYKAN
ncbi:hypothetical protein BCR42DRAFT_429854 [Absidia repens]|uniref:Uncharacterized protein n=1 Tax=Absidia repens TaxID=90262 RepID=A0A1X2HR82_9FUNG|nr:hypothetical protein BCR42DRAFT_429854 [Absidia repens]